MPDDPPAGAMRAEGAPRSVRKGDVPEALERRYYTDERGGRGLGFYADARIRQAAFRDEGRRLVAHRDDPHVARDLAAIARHRGWSIVVVQGSPAFRREAWLAARVIGIEVRGYRPTERDVQDLARRALENERRGRQDRRKDRQRDPATPEHSKKDSPARTALRVVEAVVQARVAEPKAQARILAAASARLATWLERDAVPAAARGVEAKREPTVRKERTRGR
jgi:hypothetical protein